MHFPPGSPVLGTNVSAALSSLMWLALAVSVGVQVYFCLVRARVPGPCGPVGPLARSRWPGPGGPVWVARSVSGPGAPWPGGPVPVPVQVLASCPAHGLVFRWLAPSRSRWPGPTPNKADHLCSVASFKQSLPGIWWFYAVLQTTDERQTILRSRNHYRTKTGAKRLPKPTA